MRKQLELSQLDWHDYWTIAVRRRWVLLAPLFGLGLLGSVLALIWPVRYRSEALVLIEQQKVAEQYVTPNVVVSVEDRLQSMTQQILSRTRLQRLIEQFNLYPGARARRTQAEVVEMMRKDITIDPVKASSRTGDLTAFRISYTAPQKKVAQQVTSELTSLFINDNQRARDQQATGTTQFLETQLADARKNLSDTEQRLSEYKMRYLGELPEQEQSNLQILSSLDAQLNASSSELDRLEQDKTYLESMKAGYKSVAPAAVGVTAGVPVNPVADSLRAARARLADLQTKYTDRYPEVIRTKEEISRLEAALAQQKLLPQHSSSKSAAVESASTETGDAGLIEIDSRLKGVRVDIQNRQAEINALREKLRNVQAHLNETPVREEELAGVARDYDNAKTQYESLLQKESQSELAANLEKREPGQQFRVIDPPSLPEKPVEPNRAEIVLGGWLLGLMVGLGLTAAREVTDTRIYGEAVVGQVSSLPLLVSVPLLQSPWEEAAVRRTYLIEAVMASSLVVISLSFGAYLYYWVK